MKIKDSVYGVEEVNEPVLVELIKSQPMQRLKSVSQMGIPDKYHSIKNFSRYEHSVGVMILLKRLGATLEEQVAGLLHDVSVPAFSHVSDFVFGNGKNAQEDFHETLHEKIILRSEILGIMSKHGLPIDRIMHMENYSLLERPTPDLNADRVDYGLREMVCWLNPKAAKDSIGGLININGEIVFANFKTAYVFAAHFLQLQAKNWGDPEKTTRYVVFADMIKLLITRGVLTLDDFYGDETDVMKKIEMQKDKHTQAVLNLLRSKDFYKIYKKKGEKVYKKFRYVDPKFMSKGKLVRLSKFSLPYKTMLEKHRKINKEGVIV